MLTIISGTNRPGSRTALVASHYRDELAALDLSPALLSLGDLPADFLVSDHYGARSEEFAEIEALINQTRFFVFVVPEYNGSFPGALKLFIDALPPGPAFHGKQAALTGLSSGKFGNLRGLEHLNGVLHYLQVATLPFRAHLPQIEQKLNDRGEITDPGALKEIRAQIGLIAQILRAPAFA